MSDTLSPQEMLRYSRHLLLPEIGLQGQLRLKQASVLLIGVGGLGSPSALYLAASGVGHIGLVDFDSVDESNLQRQILFNEDSVGKSKAAEAAAGLLALNKNIKISVFETKLNAENITEILQPFEVVIDGSDNFPTRYLLNDACFFLKKPLISASIQGFEGQASVFSPPEGPCYRCIYPEPPPPELAPSCSEAGVLGVLPGIAGTLQATEAIKLILNLGDRLQGRLLSFDLMTLRFQNMKLSKNPDCALCGPNPTVTKLLDYEEFCGFPQPKIQNTKVDNEHEISAITLKKCFDQGDRLVLLDMREPHEKEIARIEFSKDIDTEEVLQEIQKFDPNEKIVLFCRVGLHSLRQVHILRAQGFQNVRSLAGGINSWSQDVDPSVPQYS